MGETPADPLSRRSFLGASGAAAVTAAIGAPVVFGDRLPAGVTPVVLTGGQDPRPLDGKDGLRVLNDRPVNAETPAHLLDDDVTPASRLFVRNNGIPPAAADVDPATWTLEVAGEAVTSARTFTLTELKQRFASHTYQLTIECAGNGRSEFSPPATGNQWTTGAVGCPRWTGVRLRDVLQACGLRQDAVYIGYYGADAHLSGDPDKAPISRGVPLAKAMEDETLLATASTTAPR